MLLLDEPTNHLDAESVGWLEQYLGNFPGTVVAITHDRYFLDNVAGWILELERGKGIPYEGNYSSWLEQKHKRMALEERRESARQKELARELEWVRMSPKARASKNKARMQRYEELAQQQYDARDGAAQIQIPTSQTLGDVVVRAENPVQVVWRNDDFREHVLRFTKGRYRRHHWSERCREDDSVPNDYGP